MDIDRKVHFNYGILISLLIVAIPMFAWKLWYPFTNLSTYESLLVSFAKIGAFGGFAMFAVSLILSGRYVFYEKLFGGLDKVYIAHKLFGTMSVILLFIHPFALNLLTFEGSLATAAVFWVDVRDLGILFGALSLYGLIGLIVWTIFAKVSYETFIKVHRFLGMFFLLGAAHAFMSGSVLQESLFMQVYLLTLTLIGAVTFISYSILGDIFHRPLSYHVRSINELPHDIIEIILKPKIKTLRFSPGQFVYVSFPGFEKKEYHPFSIASGKNDGELRFAIRKSGDFTSSLLAIKEDAHVNVKGPFGGFTFFAARRKKQLWIAGGIGVTPFLSGARSLRISTERGKIEMVYATIENEPYGLKELERIEEHNPSFNVTHFHQDTFGFLTLHALQEQFKDLHERVIYLCGPPGMIQAIEKEAETLGLRKNLHFEAFSY
jgi:predicted ferric reductase